MIGADRLHKGQRYTCVASVPFTRKSFAIICQLCKMKVLHLRTFHCSRDVCDPALGFRFKLSWNKGGGDNKPLASAGG